MKATNAIGLDKWLAEWEEVFAASIRIGLLDTKTSRTIKDFLGVVPDIGFAEY
jgi:hypothetical protein